MTCDLRKTAIVAKPKARHDFIGHSKGLQTVLKMLWKARNFYLVLNTGASAATVEGPDFE